MKYLLLPLVLSSSAFAGYSADFVLNKVTLSTTLTTETDGTETSNGYSYKLVELKFSNKELLEELVSREIIPAIKGYDVVELFNDDEQIAFYAYNKKTGHAVVIPSDLLSYDDDSEESDGVYSTTFKYKTKKNVVTETWTGSFKAFTADIVVAGAEGSAFTKGSYQRTAIYDQMEVRGISASKITYVESYQANVSGIGYEESGEESSDTYTLEGSVSSKGGKVIEPFDFYSKS